MSSILFLSIRSLIDLYKIIVYACYCVKKESKSLLILTSWGQFTRYKNKIEIIR